MITFVTTAGPVELAKLAGVEWRKPTAECAVRFGTWQGQLVGVEACGKLWAVHAADERVIKSLLSYLDGHSCFGSDVWERVTGVCVPRIGGEYVAPLVDGCEAVSIDAVGKEQKYDGAAATAELEKAHPTAASVAEEIDK